MGTSAQSQGTVGKGILIITSDITEAAALADQIVIMAGGAIVDQFSSDNIEKLSTISEQVSLYQT